MDMADADEAVAVWWDCDDMRRRLFDGSFVGDVDGPGPDEVDSSSVTDFVVPWFSLSLLFRFFDDDDFDGVSTKPDSVLVVEFD